ncbi:MAG: hypothetical protein RLZZ323_1206 [Bacteroidota bacterium]|jgi:hypothetical protein
MTLKDFFTKLLNCGQEIEIYYNQDNRDDVFGFKINNIDSNYIDSNDFVYEINEEIQVAFTGTKSTLIERGEGNSSYFINKNKCIKRANYFDWVTGYDRIWIDENQTHFEFGKIEFPFQTLIINKSNNYLELEEESNLKKLIPNKLFESFLSYYRKLLKPFQEIEIELQFDIFNDGITISQIKSISGFY